ncbi:MAG: hypothetical protein AAF798_03375 [Bacteroidota bacterium]
MNNKLIISLVVLCFSIATAYAQSGCSSYTHPILSDGSTTSVPFTPPIGPPPPPPPPPSHDGDRIIFWVHGLQGNSDSWARASAAVAVGSNDFEARKVFSLNPEYPEYDLDNAAWFVHQKLVQEGDPVNDAIGNDNPETNFIVAHSQGGIVSRAVDKMYIDTDLEAERRFGGIVTFGSAHQGAQILNNFDMIIDYADAACTELTAGPIAEEILTNFWLDFFLNEDAVLETADVACTFVSEHILPMALSNFTPPITEDYKVGAMQLAELNTTPHDIPMVAVYGQEEEPILWRTIQYLGVDNPNDYEPWQANSDDKLIENVFKNTLKYLFKFMFWESEMQHLESFGLPCTQPWQWAINPFCYAWDDDYWRASKLRDNWYKGFRWLEESNNEYKIMIGARTLETTVTQNCMCLGPSGFTITPSNGQPCADQEECSLVASVDVEWIEKPSDGVVLAESAGSMPQANYSVLLPNTSHMQMRNNKEARNFFNALFGGEYGLYFRTQTR